MMIWGTSVQCDTALFTFCFEPFTDVLRSEVGNDSGWKAILCQDAREVVTHGMAGLVTEESYHRES